MTSRITPFRLYFFSFILLLIYYFFKIGGPDHSVPDILAFCFLILASLAFFSITVKQYKFTSGILLLTLTMLLFTCSGAHPTPLLVQLGETGCRLCIPYLLWCELKGKKYSETLIFAGIAATFTAHGLLAMNIISTPGNFFFMCQRILHLDHDSAAVFLGIMGALDLLISAMLLFFRGRTRRVALYYCFIWALLTALARVLSSSVADLNDFWNNGVLETLIRFPNFLLPLAALLLPTKNQV